MKKLTFCLLLWVAFQSRLSVAQGVINFKTTAPVYPAGALAHTYTAIGTPPVNVSVQVTGTTSAFTSSGSPTTPFPKSVNSGGLQASVNYASHAESVTFTFTFGAPVTGLTFNIQEIDTDVTGTATVDQVTVSGDNAGTAVAPTFSNISSHASASGNVLTGINADNTSTPTTVTFSQPVTSFTITYASGPAAKANPNQQSVTISPLSWASTTPVVLTSFNARPTQSGTVSVQWATAREENSHYFAIERSTDAQEFTEIGRLEAAGTVERARSYQFTDSKPILGTSYYRLRQVDFDGTTALYRPVAVRLLPRQPQIVLWPNPSKGTGIHINLPDKAAQFHVLRGNGQAIAFTTSSDTDSSVYLQPLEVLQTGLYFVRIQTPTDVLVQKWVVE